MNLNELANLKFYFICQEQRAGVPSTSTWRDNGRDLITFRYSLEKRFFKINFIYSYIYFYNQIFRITCQAILGHAWQAPWSAKFRKTKIYPKKGPGIFYKLHAGTGST